VQKVEELMGSYPDLKQEFSIFIPAPGTGQVIFILNNTFVQLESICFFRGAT